LAPNPAAPLRKALNDSRLGDAMIGGGIDDDLKQPCFTLGLKGVEPDNADKVGCARVRARGWGMHACGELAGSSGMRVRSGVVVWGAAGGEFVCAGCCGGRS
jgi:hypothetical protein